jgi:hypothetical protein
MASMTETQAEAGAPSFGRRLYLGWLQLAAHFGEIQTLLIVCFVYVFVLGPMAVLATIARQDLLAKRGFAATSSAWSDADSVSNPDLERAKRLF